MIAQDLVQAAENALRATIHRPQLLPAIFDQLAGDTDRLLELEGEPAAPLREAGRRIADHLVTARGAYPCDLGAVAMAMQDSLRQATLALRLTEVLPLLPAPEVPAHWRSQLHARPRFAVIQGGLA